MMSIDENLYLEALNGFQAIGSLCLAIWMFIVLMTRRIDYRKSFWKAGLSILAFHTGIAMTLGWRWIYRTMQNMGYSDSWLISNLWILVLGSVLAAIGISFKIIIYTRPGWGQWPWLTALFFASAAAIWPFVRESVNGNLWN